MQKPILDCIGLKTYYKTPLGEVKAVDDVSIQIYKGEILGICGESGCGKTTLASSIIRILPPQAYVKEGEIFLEGENILALSEEEFRQIRWKKLAYIPQSAMNSLNPVLRVEDHFLETFQVHGFSSVDRAKEVISESLSSIGLSKSVARMYPHELSGGMKQRVVIALAISLNPSILIADEPTTALDVIVQKGILELLKKIIMDHGTSMILVSHDIAIHAEIVDRLAVMYAGKIVEVGKVFDIFKEPLHPYTKALIASTPSIAVKRGRRIEGLFGLPPSLISPPKGCRFWPRCSYSFEPCKGEEPKMRNVDGSEVACHLYERKR